MGKPYGEEFEKDVNLNRFELEKEAERNPGLLRFYGELLADAKSQKDAIAKKIKLVSAQKLLFYGANPLPGTKTTEPAIKAMVDSDAELNVLFEKELEIKEKVYYLESAVATIDDRKTEIGNLTKLWLGGYYSVQGQSTNGISEQMRKDLLGG